ncbi:MAG: hypothetical protein IT330_05015 [Anaerolineae bacterium]|nr:hypothetical protein [Anaerolineae bacterium]
MKTEAVLGLILICVAGLPLVAWLVLRRVGGLRALPPWAWLALYVIALLLHPPFLLRKHLEVALLMANPSLMGQMLAQVDNEFWEQMAKLVAVLLAAWFLARRYPALLARPEALAALGFWAGLAYGVGEAVMLAILIVNPALNPIFGINLFTPFLVGFAYVYERIWAIQIHAVMGGFVGLGVWTAFRSGLFRPRWGLVLWFVAAMLYHHLVDGIIILAQFYPQVAQLLQNAAAWWLAAMVAVGYVALLVAVVVTRWMVDKRVP